jgi:hypothetical protein
MNDVYDVPVFKSLPSLINFNRNIDNNNIFSKKLYNISITDIYQDEPFMNNNNNNNNNKYFLLIFFIIILVIIFALL